MEGPGSVSTYLFNFQNEVQHAQMLDTPEYTKKLEFEMCNFTLGFLHGLTNTSTLIRRWFV